MSSEDRVFQALEVAQDLLAGQLEEGLQRHVRLSVKEHAVLQRLSHSPQGLRMNELAEASAMSPSGFTRLVDRLERETLIRRVTCPTDLRGYFVVLTEEGQSRCREADRYRTERLKEMLAGSDAGALESLAVSLEAFGARLARSAGREPEPTPATHGG